MAAASEPSIDVMRRDLRRLNRLRGRNAPAWERVGRESARQVADRRAQPLAISYPSELPISAHADAIRELLAEHQVLVVAGETGSGKTTQLPKMCLEAGFGFRGMIGHTQPRRLAARTVAHRLAHELKVDVGAAVGYATRFAERMSPNTLIKLVTDGLLLTEVRRDRQLDDYEVIIVDEAHERSLNVDFLLGYLKRLLPRRPDLRVIITSATIDVDSHAAHFGGAPVVQVGGRGYPVDVQYVDPSEHENPGTDQVILRCIQEIDAQGGNAFARDVLVFLSGEREILDVAHVLRRHLDERFEILPLYARLSVAAQQRVFQPSRYRRVVLATNVAETSLTVPNIGYVIDPGFARISRYSYRSKLQRLPVEPVSQASANQRSGRCGRVAPGRCYRLYSEADFLGRPEFTDPEIKRSNLAHVVLQMRSLGLGKVARFPFMDPPDPRAVKDAERLLTELGALKDGGLSAIGRVMARLPVDPRLARMLVAADRGRSLTEVLIIVSALGVQDPRDRPIDKQGSADRAHEQFVDLRSDFLFFVNLWHWYRETRQRTSRGALTRELGRHFLSAPRMREWHQLHRQLVLATRELGMRCNEQPADYASIHRALLTGSLSLIGRHDRKGEYLGPRNLRFRLFPGSTLVRAGPKWAMAGEITETRRVYARCVGGVEARWIEQAAADLVNRQYSEPHWSARRGEVLAYERVTLYGLCLAERRRVSYRKIDPDLCREIFVMDGLVRGGVTGPFEFLAHNRLLLADVADQEAKGRRRDLLVAEAAHADLYEHRLPREVCSVATLNGWLKDADPADLRRLYFTLDDLLEVADVWYADDQFPGSLQVRDLSLPVRYRFAPGEADDGVSVEVPLGCVNEVVGEAFEWSVPGFLEPLVEQWLRSLPKATRRSLAPLADKVGPICALLLRPERYRRGRFLPALAGSVEDLYRVRINAADWHAERLEPHLRVNIRIVDDGGKLLGQSREFAQLKARFADEVRARVRQKGGYTFERALLTEFPDDGIPATLTLDEGEGQVIAYPALVDQQHSVCRKLFTDVRSQQRADRDGFARLALLSMAQTVRLLKRSVDDDKDLGLHFAPLGDAATLSDELLRAAAWQCFFEQRPLPRSREAFERRVREERGHLADCFDDLARCLKAILVKRFALVRTCDEMTSPAFEAAVADVRAQLASLVPPDVLTLFPLEYLREIPRYLDGVAYRLEHLQGKVNRDGEHVTTLSRLSERAMLVQRQPSVTRREGMELRFALEELRLALFAEPLVAKSPRGPGQGSGRGRGHGRVSVKKIDRLISGLERELGLV